jgi:hypothetical protein
VALLSRVAAVVLFDFMRFPETISEHWQIAISLYHGQGFAFDWYGLYKTPVVGSFLPPLFSWCLYLALSLAGGSARAAVLLVQAGNIVLGTLTVYLTGRLAGAARPDRLREDVRSSAGRTLLRRIVRDPELMAGAIWAVYPPALGHVAQPQSQILETFLLVWLVFLVTRALTSRDRPFPARRAFIAGLVLGLSLLARPTVAVVWAAWGIYLLRRSAERATRLRYFLLASASAALVLAPWTVRNVRVQHRLVPISTNGGFNFYMGNNPDTGGRIPPLDRIFARMSEADREQWRSLGEVGRDHRFYALARAFWREHPWRALRGVGNKVFDFVAFRPYLFAAYPRWVAHLLVASYVLILIPFLGTLPRSRHEASAVPLLAIAVTGLMCCVYVVSMRFRSTVEPLMAAVASAGRPFDRIRDRTSSPRESFPDP